MPSPYGVALAAVSSAGATSSVPRARGRREDRGRRGGSSGRQRSGAIEASRAEGSRRDASRSRSRRRGGGRREKAALLDLPLLIIPVRTLPENKSCFGMFCFLVCFGGLDVVPLDPGQTIMQK